MKCHAAPEVAGQVCSHVVTFPGACAGGLHARSHIAKEVYTRHLNVVCITDHITPLGASADQAYKASFTWAHPWPNEGSRYAELRACTRRISTASGVFAPGHERVAEQQLADQLKQMHNCLRTPQHLLRPGQRRTSSAGSR